MRIRTAREGDAAAVAALWTEGYTGRGEGEGRRTPYDGSDYAQSAREGRVFVAERGDGIVGVVVFFPPGVAAWATAVGEAGLSRLVVGKSAQGRGVGRALVELCTARAREAGAEAIVLWSRPYQRDAHRLYESLGYRRAPQRDSRDADGGRWVFALELTPSR
ncbi:MAG TPA: GNAT family N-acetyltransferase [Solirubrobacterales bacterium]|nr:GNAT family N-acetyltransferase [Solirubrobacterales bacterium]